MNRRRMMMIMSQQNKVDLLEGHRLNNKSVYGLHAVWLDNNTVRLSHLSGSFAGPNIAAVNFIGTGVSASTAYPYVLGSNTMKTLEIGKRYKLTLTILDIVKNTATAKNDGTLTIAFGRSGGSNTDYVTTVEKQFSELAIGDKIELTKSYMDTYYVIGGAAFQAVNASIQFDINFKIDFEEVK